MNDYHWLKLIFNSLECINDEDKLTWSSLL